MADGRPSNRRRGIVLVLAGAAVLAGAVLLKPRGRTRPNTLAQMLMPASPGARAAAGSTLRAAVQEIMAGQQMTPEEVVDLEAQLVEDPENMTARTKLLGYYSRSRMGASERKEPFQRHVMWIIEHRPESEIASMPYTHLDRVIDGSASDRAAALWLGHVEAQPRNLRILANAASFFTRYERARALELLERARQMQPENPEWPRRLAHLHDLSTFKAGRIDEESAQRACDEYEKALANADEGGRFNMLGDAAKAALLAQHYDRARALATELLNGAVEREETWNYGRALHDGNLVLGHVALIEGDVSTAERHLLLAGKTPELSAFGPNMLLAKALLEAGRSEAVIEYLQLCRTPWPDSRLDTWIGDIEEGRMPHFGPNLRY